MPLLDVVAAGVFILSISLVAIAIRSYRRTGNKKLLFTVGAFLLFFLVGVVLFFFQYAPDVDPEAALAGIGSLNFLILLLLYFATLKR